MKSSTDLLSFIPYMSARLFKFSTRSVAEDEEINSEILQSINEFIFYILPLGIFSSLYKFSS